MNQTKKQFPQSQSQTIWDGCDIPVHLELEDLEPRFILSRRVALFWSEVLPRLRNASAIGVDNVPASGPFGKEFDQHEIRNWTTAGVKITE